MSKYYVLFNPLAGNNTGRDETVKLTGEASLQEHELLFTDMTEIKNYTFDGCISLREISLPGSIVSIGSGAFQKCASLTEITIGFNTTFIGNYAFVDCSSLANVYFQNPDGWVTLYSEIQAEGTPIEVTQLNNPRRAASFVRGDSSKWYMRRDVKVED